jgi:hypothetical protein
MGTLIEPRVLAEAKEFLLPPEPGHGYAMVDAQFRTDSWGQAAIEESIRSDLEPINSLQMASGQPDAILAPPKPETYRGDIADTVTVLPLAVIEAKGETRHNRTNTTRTAITQAHGHLQEANLGFAAVPHSSISETDRSLAQELNIGLLAVAENNIEIVEKPRLVGTETTPTAETLRFHAQLGGTAVESLKKNHPKNALGYALAVQHSEDTEKVFKRYVIASVSDARLDATALGLVSMSVEGLRLTPAGREAVRTIKYQYGGIEDALEKIDEHTGSSRRFIDICPVMGTVIRQSILSYPPTQVLIDTLGDLANQGYYEPTLAQVAKAVAAEHPDFALDLFVSTRFEDRQAILNDHSDSPLDQSMFENGDIYSTHTTFQYKAMLYHVGLLTERGTDTKSKLDPTSEVWALETLVEG